MKNLKYALILFMGALLIINVSGCKRRPRAGSGVGDGTSPIRGLPGDNIYAEGLGTRAGFGGEHIEGQFEPVLFAFDSAQVAEAERWKLEEVATYLRRNPGANVIVEGHTDERGSRAYNLSLGERRALASRAYLIGLGVDGSRLQTRSYGAERPAAHGHNEEAWRQNRRSEFIVTQ